MFKARLMEHKNIFVLKFLKTEQTVKVASREAEV